MKTKIYLCCLLSLVLSSTATLFGQTLSAGKAGKFGIDGDIYSDTALSGVPKAQMSGTHDWFQKSGGVGIGLFDTVGAAAIRQRILNGENYPFTKKMQYDRYAVVDGNILMDAVYARDYIGLNSTPIDKTSFVLKGSIANTFAQDPSTWVTAPSDGTMPSKTDIIDTYVNMRRDGTTYTNASHLMLYVGVSTLATDGSHYISFLFSKSRMTYDSTSGQFSNSGPAETGGHSAWSFNADGTLKEFGDIALSFVYDGSGISAIQVLIWCNYNDYATTQPTKFQFVAGQWNGTSTKSGWGWAAVMPAGLTAMKAWGAVSTATTAAPAWGTNSKDLGTIASNYASTNYSLGQFGEAAVDLTIMGIDPVLYTSYNSCNPPFTRYFVVSRNSSGNSSPLEDFTGPYPFLDAPAPPSEIAHPGVFTCANNAPMDLSPATYTKGAYYSWFTPDGAITQSNPDSSTIKVSKPGTYTLNSAFAKGCTQSTSTIVVGADYNKPVAMAASTGLPAIGGIATLFGGDPVASNYQTPYGRSQGLSFKWTGPSGFPNSTLQNPTTTQLGNYQLIVTEARNGCKDTAFTTVAVNNGDNLRIGVLAVKFTDFTVNTNRQQKLNRVAWTMPDVSEVDRFVVEKSSNRTDFVPAGYVFPQNATTTYRLNDPLAGGATYYRIKAVTKEGVPTYSSTIKIQSTGVGAGLAAYSDGSGSIVVNYTAPSQEAVTVTLLNMNGQVLRKEDRSVATGENVFRITDIGRKPKGIYLVRVESAGDVQAARVSL